MGKVSSLVAVQYPTGLYLVLGGSKHAVKYEVPEARCAVRNEARSIATHCRLGPEPER